MGSSSKTWPHPGARSSVAFQAAAPAPRAATPPRRRRARGNRGASSLRSFDHLVGASEHARWHFDAEGLGSLEVDDEIEFCRLLDGHLARFCTAENLGQLLRHLPINLCQTRTITQ